MSMQPQSDTKIATFTIFRSQRLGKGQFGEVYQCLNDEDQKTYAVKQIDLRPIKANLQIQKLIHNEIEVLKICKHPNLLYCKEIKWTENNLYMFLELCNGGTLTKYLEKFPGKRMSEQEAKNLVWKILNGYKFLNDKNIIHRDLKPDNILLHDGTPKIADYGFGKVLQGDALYKQMRQTNVYTPLYASPQLLEDNNYSSKCDIWSLGIIFYQILYGRLPFIAADENTLTKAIKQKCENKSFICPQEFNISQQTRDLLKNMICYKEESRYTVDEILRNEVFKNLSDDILDNQELSSVPQKSNPDPISETLNNSRIQVQKYNQELKTIINQPGEERVRLPSGSLLNLKYQYIQQNNWQEFESFKQNKYSSKIEVMKQIMNKLQKELQMAQFIFQIINIFYELTQKSRIFNAEMQGCICLILSHAYYLKIKEIQKEMNAQASSIYQPYILSDFRATSQCQKFSEVVTRQEQVAINLIQNFKSNFPVQAYIQEFSYLKTFKDAILKYKFILNSVNNKIFDYLKIVNSNDLSYQRPMFTILLCQQFCYLFEEIDRNSQFNIQSLIQDLSGIPLQEAIKLTTFYMTLNLENA